MERPEGQGRRAVALDSEPPRLLRYGVIACGDDWRVLSGRALIGHFPSRGAALAVAVSLTRQAIEAGHEAELYAQAGGCDFLLYPLFPSRAARPD